MEIPVEVVTIDSLPTIVIAETTSWEFLPSLWPKLCDEVYAFVRCYREFAGPDSDDPALAGWATRTPRCTELQAEIYPVLR